MSSRLTTFEQIPSVKSIIQGDSSSPVAKKVPSSSSEVGTSPFLPIVKEDSSSSTVDVDNLVKVLDPIKKVLDVYQGTTGDPRGLDRVVRFRDIAKLDPTMFGSRRSLAFKSRIERITGNIIRTGRIESHDSRTFFDLDGDRLVFNGKTTYSSSMPGFFMGKDSDGVYKINIESGNYVSGSHGSGFKLTPDLLEVGNINCRGIFRTAVFQKDTISAIGGNLLLLPSDVLTTDISATDTTLTIEGNETFAVGDFLRIKSASYDEWFEITNADDAPSYTVTRDKGGDYATDPTWPKGSTVVDYGASGDGGILFTSCGTNAPHMSIFDHAGAPWDTLNGRVRIGNLNGFLGVSSDLYGIGIGSDATGYLKYNTTDGLVIKGSITVMDGSSVGDQVNHAHPRYSLFEEDTLPPTAYGNGTVSLEESISYFGGNSLKMVASDDDHWLFLAVTHTTYNIKLTPNKKWILSAYVRCDAAAKAIQLWLKTSDGVHHRAKGDNSNTTHASADTWKRVYGVVDLSADDSTQANIRLDNDGGAGVTMYWDGIMLEPQIGEVETPSVYSKPPLSGAVQGWEHSSDVTKIDGGDIYTGSVTAAKITVDDLSAINADMGTITAGNITLDDSGFIRTTGKDNYADTTAGIFLGYDTDAYKFNIGDANSYIKWSGSALDVQMASGETFKLYGSFSMYSGSYINFYDSGGTPSLIGQMYWNTDTVYLSAGTGTDLALQAGSDIELDPGGDVIIGDTDLLRPYSAGSSSIGSATYPFSDIIYRGSIVSYYSTTATGSMQSTSTAFWVQANTGKWLGLEGPAGISCKGNFIANAHNTYELGSATNAAWKKIWGVNLNISGADVTIGSATNYFMLWFKATGDSWAAGTAVHAYIVPV